MFSRFRTLAGLLAIATIAIAVPTISKAQTVVPCATTFSGTTCYTGYVMPDAIFDNTPCKSGATYGVIYREAANALLKGQGCYSAVGNCICH